MALHVEACEPFEMKNAQALLRWLLSRPDPGELGWRPLDLLEIKKDLSEEMWEPASLDGMSKPEIEQTYRRLCIIAKSLRTGEDTSLSGYGVKVPVEGETTIQPVVRQTSANRYEIILLCAILTAKDSLRRCKECKALFVRHKRQKYCREKCAVRERVRRYRKRHSSVAWSTEPRALRTARPCRSIRGISAQSRTS